MFNPDKVRLILLNDFVNIQAKNPSYSMRAYASKVGISQSAISEILSGKRSITKKSAEVILKGLDKDPQEIRQVLHAEIDNQDEYKSIDLDIFHTIADWHYFAILSLTQTEGFQSSEDWISKRLGISLKTAKDALERLLRLGLLEKKPRSEKLIATGEPMEVTSLIAHPALKKACRQNITLAQNALERTDFESRDMTAITVCFDPDRMNEAKKMIKSFRRNFAKAMESKKKKEVYKLTIQLFPLTTKLSKEKL